MNSNRPFFLKSRILSDKGHLSNEDADEIISNSIGESTKEIYLAHISRDCNTKQLAYDSLIKAFNERNYDYKNLKIKALDQEETLQGGNLYEKDYLSV
jgi:phosphoribosyl 1,2-cyclic phosphodiesterase